MMHGRGKSDPAIVARKPTNKAGRPVAEPVERRAGAEGNAGRQSTLRAQNRECVTRALDRVRQAAKQRKKERFTSLLHHISLDLLQLAFSALKRDAAAGVDGLTWQDYEADLERKLEDLHTRVHRGAYRALPSQRRYIPKPDGRQRPLAVAAREDKIVQRATVAVLNAIYEGDFLGFSYGFRPKRSQHDAPRDKPVGRRLTDALVVGITSKKVNYILDADIRSFFDSVSQEWLIRFPGSSPRTSHRIGDRRIIRLIQKWLKAGVLEDGVVRVSDTGTGQGSVISPLLANVYLHYVLDLWAQRRHRPIPEQGLWLRQVVSGFFNYHAVPTNFRALAAFRSYVTRLWRRALRRRSQKDHFSWARIEKLADDWLPKPRILHPWPSVRFAVNHPRGEPYAGKPHVRFCAGGAQ